MKEITQRDFKRRRHDSKIITSDMAEMPLPCLSYFGFKGGYSERKEEETRRIGRER
jgi:hypothetical protein